jgi:hypothetical protein
MANQLKNPQRLKQPKSYNWPLEVETLCNGYHLMHGTWKMTKIFPHFIHVTKIYPPTPTHVSQH